MEYPKYYYAKVSNTFVKLENQDTGAAIVMLKEGTEFDFRFRSIDNRWVKQKEGDTTGQYQECDAADWGYVANLFVKWNIKKLAEAEPELVKQQWETAKNKLV